MTISQINPNQLRPNEDDGLGQIVQIGPEPPERRADAIERLVATGSHGDRDHARRFLEYARAHRIDLQGLWSRLDRRGSVCASVLTVPSPGRTAMVFASRAITADDIVPLARLIDHACRALSASDVNLAQVLLAPESTLEHEVFRAAGFQELAVLSYLERPLRSLRGMRAPQPQWPTGVTVERYREALRDELLAVLDASYEDTLDCPGLRGKRDTCDILEGHRTSGVFEPSLWTILRIDGKAAGALLLNPAADHQSIELVYLGLAKSARGRGLGTQLLRHGLALAMQRRERLMTLAVDESNAPAIALYRREGFQLALRRVAMIRPLHQQATQT